VSSIKNEKYNISIKEENTNFSFSIPATKVCKFFFFIIINRKGEKEYKNFE
jgi:hypothetical protein